MEVPRDWEMGLGVLQLKPLPHPTVPTPKPTQPTSQTIHVTPQGAGGWHSGNQDAYSTDPAPAGTVLLVYTTSTGAQYATLQGGGVVSQVGVGPLGPVQVNLDGREIARNTTGHQERDKRRRATQTRGRPLP